MPSDGHYTFKMKAQGKAFLKIHEIAAIDEGYNYKGEEKRVTLNLAKGYHHIRLYFMKVKGETPDLKLAYSHDGTRFKDVNSYVPINRIKIK
ncbi:PA14 domain-containing protein [Pedobacter segetis]|nr:PA14 domain-containing protein [Pedobacter segetis]